MILFTSKDLKAISETIHALRKASVPGDLSRALVLVSSAVKAKSGGIAIMRADGCGPSEAVLHNVDEEFYYEYRDKYDALKIVPWKAVNRGICVWRATDLMTQMEWDNSEVNRVSMRPRGIYHPIGVAFGTELAFLGLMWLARTKNDAPFSDKDLNLVEILQPHFEDALRKMLRQPESDQIRESLINGTEKMKRPVFIVDKEGTPVYINSVASRIFAEEGVSRQEGLERIELAVAGRGICVHTQAAPVESLAAVCTLGGLPYRLLSFFIEGTVSRYRVTIAIDSLAILGQFFRRAFSRYPFTERESEICLMLVQGRSNRDIAETLNISELTVKDHVKAVLGKLPVKTRAEVPMHILCMDEDV